MSSLIIPCRDCGHEIHSGEWGRPNRSGVTRCTDCGAVVVIDADKASSHRKSIRRCYIEHIRLQDHRYYQRNRERIVQHNSRAARLTHKRLRGERCALLGNRCNLCGYDECVAILDFHHKHSEHKTNTNDWKTKRFEPSEFLLLCPNCHKKIHLGLIDGSEVNDETPTGAQVSLQGKGLRVPCVGRPNICLGIGDSRTQPSQRLHGPSSALR